MLGRLSPAENAGRSVKEGFGHPADAVQTNFASVPTLSDSGRIGAGLINFNRNVRFHAARALSISPVMQNEAAGRHHFRNRLDAPDS